MKLLLFSLVLCLLLICCRNNPSGCKESGNKQENIKFPKEIVNFVSYDKNPVFAGTGENTWDQNIRERGYILKEDGVYYLWYTGYRDGEDEEMHLGLATSPDGLVWTRYKDNPIFDACWTEDMMALKSGNVYYMFAEGRGDTAHMLTSSDKIHFEEKGQLDVRNSDGSKISAGAYGTPFVFPENNKWYLFYEREDLGIWVAVSEDMKVWTNIVDTPVIAKGPEQYDKWGVAMDQVIKYKGTYFGFYHATEFEDWHEWTSCVAASKDLVHWIKYPCNPIMRENKSSPVMVFDGHDYRLYTMHPSVSVHFPASRSKNKK